jgi:hypothetical protein
MAFTDLLPFSGKIIYCFLNKCKRYAFLLEETNLLKNKKIRGMAKGEIKKEYQKESNKTEKCLVL